MPTYNGERFIDRSIDSVLSQTFEDFELIVVNDGSTDFTEDIVRVYHDRRIVYVSNKQNLGTSKARNIGLAHARGEYIAYCDHDDIYYPNHLEELAGVLDRRPDTGLAYCDYRTIKLNKPLPLGKRIEFSKDGLEVKNIIGPPLVVMHRIRCVKEAGGFDESFTINKDGLEDHDLWLRFSDIFKCYHLNKVLCGYILHDKNRSLSTCYRKSYPYLIKKRWRKIKTRPERIEYINRNGIAIIKILCENGCLDHATELSSLFFVINKNYQGLACLGLCNAGRGDFKNAINLLNRSLKLMPPYSKKTSPEIRQREDLITIKLALSNSYLQSNDIEKAMKMCKQILLLAPADIDTRYILARCYIKKNMYGKALASVKDIREALSFTICGACYFFQKRYNDAARAFRAEIRKYGKSACRHYNLGTAYAGQGLFKRAVHQFEDALKLDPGHAQAKEMMGLCLAKKRH